MYIFSTEMYKKAHRKAINKALKNGVTEKNNKLHTVLILHTHK